MRFSRFVPVPPTFFVQSALGSDQVQRADDIHEEAAEYPYGFFIQIFR